MMRAAAAVGKTAVSASRLNHSSPVRRPTIRYRRCYNLASCQVSSFTRAVTRVEFTSYKEDLDEFVTFFSRESRRLQL